jgi:hypothetical protein
LPRPRRARANPGEPLVRLDIYESGGEVGARAYSVEVDDMPAQIAKVRDNLFKVEAQVPTNPGPRDAVASVTTAITW